MQRLDFLSSKKRWETEMAQQALTLEDDELPVGSPSCPGSPPGKDKNFVADEELQEADAFLERETRELEALISALTEEQASPGSLSELDGNDEVDYDKIFMEYLAQSDLQAQPVGGGIVSDVDAMDTSDG
jgi:hypothetical protein